MERLRVDGRFFRAGTRRETLRLVTWGPFPAGFPADPAAELDRVKQLGFNGLRLYEWPERGFLDHAAERGQGVFAAPLWQAAADFVGQPQLLAEARAAICAGLATTAGHPALAGVFVANEVPADLVRWMGPALVRDTIEELIRSGRGSAPELLWCYGNYPSTEYLEPGNADFTAMNVYLEDEGDLRRYLRRLHHVAGDRPVVLGEFGLDSRRGGRERQAEVLRWAIRAARDEGMAGFTVYGWSDRWWNRGEEVPDWDFGLTDRAGNDKPAAAAVAEAFAASTEPAEPEPPATISVVVCTRDGHDRIGACLEAVGSMQPAAHEVIVVDDGSTDGTSERVAREFPGVRLLRSEGVGLSAARNLGAAAATGEFVAFTDDDCEPDRAWLGELARGFADGWDAVGGPNLPPPPADRAAAVTAAAPGSASHVMLDDREAEHVPGCNLAVRRSTYFELGGFDPDFVTAGDDVDFCWRLRDAGRRIGFRPNAFVWHHRRPTLSGYLRQQVGYGRAEALLMRKHPRRFSPSGDAVWRGAIYSGGPLRVTGDSVIYHGGMGLAGYQGVVARMQPLRALDDRFDGPLARLELGLVSWLAPRLRAWLRIRRFRGPVRGRARRPAAPAAELRLRRERAEPRELLLRRALEAGWEAGEAGDGWDLRQGDTRVLVAVEPGDRRDMVVLLRVWGEPAGIEERLRLGAAADRG